MCAAWPTSRRTTGSGTPFDTVKGGDYLVDQDAAEVMAREAIDAGPGPGEDGACPFNRTPEGRIDQRRFGGHPATTARPPYAAPASRPTAPGT
jgi:succinate dehydrogenase / fumarate reductase flavoprotein subunit